MSENPGISQIDKMNIDASGYGEYTADYDLAANISEIPDIPTEGIGNYGTAPFTVPELSEFPTDEYDSDFSNLPKFDDSNLPVGPIPTFDNSSELRQTDDFGLPNYDSTDALGYDSGSLSIDDIPGTEYDCYPPGDHSYLLNFNNNYNPDAPASVNFNNQYNPVAPNSAPANSDNSNIDNLINNSTRYCTAPSASASNPNYPPPPPPPRSSSTTSMPTNPAFMQDLSYLGLKAPGGLNEVEELARYSYEQADFNSTGWNMPIFSSNLLDWGWIPNHRKPIKNDRCPIKNDRCKSCPLLRRIIHTNGIQDSRLEIHGLQGEAHHAVCECRLCTDDGTGTGGNQSCEIIMFSPTNPEHVKQFIAEYNEVRRTERALLRYDSFLLNTDIGRRVKKQTSGSQGYWNWNKNPRGNNDNHHEQGSSSGSYAPKSTYSAQRQRARNLQMPDLAKYFHLPISDAGKKLRISPTVMKNVCRKNGLSRWPYRKIQSIRRNIESLEKSMQGETGETRKSIANQIERLKNEETSLYGNFVSQKK